MAKTTLKVVLTVAFAPIPTQLPLLPHMIDMLRCVAAENLHGFDAEPLARIVTVVYLGAETNSASNDNAPSCV